MGKVDLGYIGRAYQLARLIACQLGTDTDMLDSSKKLIVQYDKINL